MPLHHRKPVRAIVGAALIAGLAGGGLAAAGALPASADTAAASPGGLSMGAPQTTATSNTSTVSTATKSPRTPTVAPPAGTKGTDVSYYTGDLDASAWLQQYNLGARFAIVKTTEGNNAGHAVTSTSKSTTQYPGAAASQSMPDLYRGSYHYANLVNASSGETQATEFLDALRAQGASWTAGTQTLPPTLDLEEGTSAGYQCYKLTKAQTVAWISAFSNKVLATIGVRPIIYTNSDFWSTCTGNSAAFESNPLFFAHPGSSTGTLPASWSTDSLWQYSQTTNAPLVGDQDVFTGTATQLKVLSNGNRTATIAANPNGSATGVGPGRTLASGQAVHSANLQYSLQMQTDGNLVEKDAGRVIWNSKTAGHAGATLTVQTDGNVVIYAKGSKTALWNTHTAGFSNSHLMLQSDGDVQVTTSTGVAWRSLAAGADTLSGTTSLSGGQYLHSADGTMQFAMQTDGNLVAYVGGKAVFNTHTSGNAGAHLALQADGNLVLYSHAGKALWNTHTSGTGAANRLVVNAGGTVQLLSGSRILWSATETAY
jgi:GH25 family lysozyme M1 (1,4-beta-N-acetylmuramidase)